MSYETYSFLRSLLDMRIQLLEKDFQTACCFIPSETCKRNQKSGLDKAHEIFRKEYRRLEDMKEELHDAAAASHHDHPNPEMRKFWGLKV